MLKFQTAAIIIIFGISGCASLPGDYGTSESGIDGEACTGIVAVSVPALLEATNPTLLTRAKLPKGKGGACSAKVFSAVAPVVVYRVFDASNPNSKFGSWWSLKNPSGSKEDYRAANAICREWSALDRVISCEVRPGTQVVIGTTQSAVCSDGSMYPQTDVNQVFVANDGRAGILHVGACSEEGNWP